MSRPSFSAVKKHYKTNPSSIHSCSMYFPNTCAIRMSEALSAASESTKARISGFPRNKCPHGYLRGAQDLGAALRSAWGTRDFGWSGSGATPKTAMGVQGVICFMNIPGFGGQGHIDLWDKDHAIGSEYWDAGTIWLWKLA
ncbi:hypothetical protein DXX93_08920 [Thalassotalea euphylliae]|uniref:Type VI secretion system amidase effector protein Tae4 n=1 Tax=Thalassotalea euphylliae TaxID=1655234 RepID=A0A3E0TQ87_9GAMM|nr:T6SS effector amidase Tae4 family protein [Thalassotalea euphylliae]REL26684.1 hypothetical protein DXX93_08920 [Thalassotalea euphylliae]